CAVAHQRQRDRFDDDVVERNLAAPPLCAELFVERLAGLRGALHVDFGREEEVRDRPKRRREPLGDRFPNLRERDVFVRNARASYVGRRAWYRRGSALDVALDDPAAWT